MAIRPIDLQVMMPRALESSKTSAHEEARPMMEHQQFTAKVEKDVYNEQRTVIQSNKTEDSKINKDGKGNSGGQTGSRRDRRNRGKDSNALEQDSLREGQSLIDLKL